MDNINKFTEKANAYVKGRHGYCEAFIDYLFTSLGFNEETTAADIGSGTGIFSRQLLEKGATVFGVEPNDDMRLMGEKELASYDKFISVSGSSSNTTLKDNSVDFVTAAQAFHWFDIKPFYNECKRILKPEGKVILIWNTRDEKDEINREIALLNKKYCPEFKGFSAGFKEHDERICHFFNGEYEKLIFDNPIYYNEDSFISRLLSSSYSLKKGDKGYDEFLCEIKCIFSSYEVGGKVKVNNSTVAYIGKVQ